MHFLSSTRLWFALSFAISLGQAKAGLLTESSVRRRAQETSPTLSISGGSLTTRWFEGSDHVQIIEMTVRNTHASNALTLAHALHVTASSSSLEVVTPGNLTRLMPSHEAIVRVGVKNKAGVSAGSSCSATITATWGGSSSTTALVKGNCGFADYTTSSLAAHQAPDWYNDAKYGIFIHWGIFSVPGYGGGPGKERYAEWYWNFQHRSGDKTQTYQYHEATYGKNFNYDDFFPNFTAKAWDPKAWVDLVNDAGAKYLVPVTKHHDGFALFDAPSTTSTRTSVHYGPKRDLIKELLTAAKTYYPTMRRGTYFSLPEWYHPDYSHQDKKYGANLSGANFKGGPPTNPYTGATITYTGYVKVGDYVRDLQRPQMETLVNDYDTDIMWCDVGGPNDSANVLTPWSNAAQAQGRQVTWNNRCGVPGDFDTPEFKTNANTVVAKWESNRGMDPGSFGYNYLTPDSSYLSGPKIVTSLVDIVSKNGNLLLDIGPRNDGSIPDIMQKNLRDAGTWINAHAESIFGTRYWSVTAGQDPFRYTTKSNAFYIHYTKAPGATITVTDAVPWMQGDTVTVVGGSSNGAVVPAKKDSSGHLVLTISDTVRAADKYVWTFKIAYTSTL